MFDSQGHERRDGAPGLVSPRLTPGDQLLSISLVNLILFGASWAVLDLGYGAHQPSLPPWVMVTAVILLVGPAALATSDSWLPRINRLLKGNDDTPVNGAWDIHENVLRGAVFAFTIVNLVVLWQLTDKTAGVGGPFVPFLTAPAVFSPFVARNPIPVGVLSAAVVGGIWILEHTTLYNQGHVVTPRDWTYKLVATMMIAIAGALTMVRLSVGKRGTLTSLGVGDQDNQDSGNEMNGKEPGSAKDRNGKKSGVGEQGGDALPETA